MEALKNIRQKLYDLLVLKPEIPDLAAQQKLDITQSGGNKSGVKVFMLQSQIGQVLNFAVVECLKELDELEEDLQKPIEIQGTVQALPEPGNVDDLDEMEDILNDLVEVCYHKKRMCFDKFKKVTKDAYLRKVFKHTDTNEEAAKFLRLGRTYISRRFNEIGLYRDITKGRRRKRNVDGVHTPK